MCPVAEVLMKIPSTGFYRLEGRKIEACPLHADRVSSPGQQLIQNTPVLLLLKMGGHFTGQVFVFV